MNYRCLVLDHDDTVAQSTPEIHYPSFAEAMRLLRPNAPTLTLDEFISHCFQPGFTELCRDILQFNQEEQEQQYKIWKSYTQNMIPSFYPGISQLLKRYKAAGGLLTVVSHSESEQILRDYQLNCGFTPDLVFGWELPAEQRKPNPYPLQEIMRRFQLRETELLVVDDLKPGLIMARSCKVPFAAAGWSHTIPAIRAYMNANADYYFSTVSDFSDFIMATELERG